MRNPAVFLAATVTAIAVLLLSSLAHAGTATVTWTNPTTKEDGTALAASAILRTEVEYSTSSTFASGVSTANAAGAATSLVIPSIGPGTYYFRAFTVSAAGRSGASNVASKVVPDSPPSPPTLTTVTATAYRFEIGAEGYVRLVHVPGVWLPKGQPCTPIPGLATYGIAGDYVRRCLKAG